MSRSLVPLVCLLGGMFALFAWLLTDADSVRAGGRDVSRPPRRAADPASAPFLSQLARVPGTEEASDAGPRSAVAGEFSLAPGSDLGLRPALLDVPMDWSLPQSEWRARVASLDDVHVIAGLRDDNVKWNAITSSSVLRGRLRAPGWAPTTRAALERAFEAPATDSQLQRLAAGLLQAHSLDNSAHDPHEPGEALLEYSVALLENGVSWRGEIAMAGAISSRQTLAFGLAQQDRMAARIAEALGEVGPERGFAHAFLLGKGGYEEYVHLAAPILVEHLRDNSQSEDALMSLEALTSLGDLADPWLWSALRVGDAQQAHCIRLLLEKAGKLEPPLERERGETLSEPLTWKFENPAGAWRFLENSAR